ncbi:methyltransferase domain-containing protein [Lacibacter sp. MH-610]|uniref:methyltransferase domain-containing protein n=1 Tax=Lacibacter sp. MH-610 TaxID=3020883 RepID=UPI0038921942
MDFLSPEYWESRYKEQQTGWDIGKPSTPLADFIDRIPNKNASILIPGCGNSYEAEYLVEQGFTHVTVIDIAPSPVERLQQKIGDKAKVLLQDFFEHKGQYDYILEQTFFCALDPSLRPAYVIKMKKLLAEQGKLAGVLFNRQFETNPPFGGSKKEYEELFARELKIIKMEECYNSIPPRAGTELFFIATKKHS